MTEDEIKSKASRKAALKFNSKLEESYLAFIKNALANDDLDKKWEEEYQTEKTKEKNDVHGHETIKSDTFDKVQDE
jgi:hypothetical protein